MIYTVQFWKDAAERAIKTFAQFVIALLTGNAFDWWSVDWAQIGGAALTAVILSLAMSLVSANVGTKGTASLVE